MSWEGGTGDGPSRRVPTAVVVVVVAVLAGVAYLVAGRDGAAPADPLEVGPRDDAAATADPDPLGVEGRPGRSESLRSTRQTTGAGPLLPGLGPRQVVLANFVSRLLVLDVDAGDLTTLDVFSDQRRVQPSGLQRIGDDLVLDAGSDVVRIGAALDGSTTLARGQRMVPTSSTGSVWVYDGEPLGFGGTARLVDADGTVRRRIGLPALAQPLAGTDDGLVVRTPGGVVAIDGETGTGTGRRVTDGPGLVSDGERLAWLDCDGTLTCFVVVGPLAEPDGVRVQLDPADTPHAVGPLGGAFSPDGRWLALPVSTRERGQLGEQHDVLVIDLRLGAVAQRVDGSQLTSPTPLAWSPDSSWLAVSSGSRLRAWRVEDNQAVDLPVQLSPTYALVVR